MEQYKKGGFKIQTEISANLGVISVTGLLVLEELMVLLKNRRYDIQWPSRIATDHIRSFYRFVLNYKQHFI